MKSTSSKALRGMLGALLGNSIFGFSFMFSRVALNVAPPFVMLMHRFIIAALVLGCVAAAAHRKGAQGFMRFDLRGKQVGGLILLGLVQPVIYFLCESYGISMTNATVSGVIIALVPIMALAAAAVLMHEKPTKKQVFCSVLSIAGVAVMTLMQNTGGEIRLLGVVLLIGAVITGAGFNIISRSLSQKFSALERTFVMMLVAAISFTALAVCTSGGEWQQMTAPLTDKTYLGCIGYLSILSSVLAFLGLNFATTVLPVRQTAAFSNVTTVLSVFAGVVFLGDAFNLVTLIASVVIIIGVIGVQKE